MGREARVSQPSINLLGPHNLPSPARAASLGSLLFVHSFIHSFNIYVRASMHLTAPGGNNEQNSAPSKNAEPTVR